MSEKVFKIPVEKTEIFANVKGNFKHDLLTFVTYFGTSLSDTHHICNRGRDKWSLKELRVPKNCSSI